MNLIHQDYQFLLSKSWTFGQLDNFFHLHSKFYKSIYKALIPSNISYQFLLKCDLAFLDFQLQKFDCS